MLITLQDFQIKKRTITGTDTNGLPVLIEHINKKENIAAWASYQKDLKTISQQDINSYIFTDSNRALFKMEHIIYEQLWKPVSEVSQK